MKELEGKNSIERSKLKAEAFSKLVKPEKFAKHGCDIEIVDLATENDLLKVTARVTKDGAVVFDDAMYYKNPPILVPDGTKRTVVDRDGNERLEDNFKEDLDEALKQIVAETVRIIIK